MRRFAARLCIVLLVTAAIVIAADLCVASIAAQSNEHRREGFRMHRSRPHAPQPRGVGEFAVQCGLMALITFGGRKILKLRL